VAQFLWTRADLIHKYLYRSRGNDRNCTIEAEREGILGNVGSG
jgi:hypothetical protein